MNNYFVILAAGKSKRFHKNLAKQFFNYKNKEIIDHSIEKALDSKLFKKIIIVANNLNHFKKKNYSKQISIIKGGKERSDSSLKALKYIKKYKPLNVYIHDAARPNFSIKLNAFTILNALNSKQIPTKSISGDVESALIFLGAMANIDIDLELLVYKYFGDIPAIILRKVILTQSADKDSLRQENEANKILESFRDLSIRLDRLEHALIN